MSNIVLVSEKNGFKLQEIVSTPNGLGKIVRIEHIPGKKPEMYSTSILVELFKSFEWSHRGYSILDGRYHCPNKNGYWYRPHQLKKATIPGEEKKEKKETNPRIQRIIKAKDELKDGGFTRDETFELIKMLIHKGEI